VISIQGAGKFLGKKELFADVSFHIKPGDRVALIGPNGTGKTTLFHVLTGEVEPDEGSVSRAKHLSIGLLAQEVRAIEGSTVLQHALDVHRDLTDIQRELETITDAIRDETDPEVTRELTLRQAHFYEILEHRDAYRIETRAQKILAGLGFKPEEVDRPVDTLSGGWAMRLELARLLLMEPDLLLLDEPTNHLDIESQVWLEDYLRTSYSAVVIVSHDRAFLNATVTRVLELENARLSEFPGNYDAYVEQKAQRREIQAASFKNQQERIKQIERFIDKNRCRKDRSKQVQSRIKHLDKMDRLVAPTETHEVHFTFPQPQRSGKISLELKGVRKRYGDREVYGGVDLVIERGERIAIIGPNGAGKSTLLKVLAGVLPLDGGERVPGHQVSTGYYAQHQWQQLDLSRTVLEEATGSSGDVPQTQLRGLLGAFLFSADDVGKKVSVLSGGEKARLVLVKLLLARPNVLLMDEPTNHLDIPSRIVLEKALQEFTGTICFISHDRRFIDAIATKTLFVQEGKLHVFPGNYNDFQNLWAPRLAEDASGPLASGSGASAESERAPSPAQQKSPGRKRQEAEWRNEFFRLKKPLQQKVDDLEQALDTAQAELDRLNEKMGDPATYSDSSLVVSLRTDYQQCQARIQGLTADWESAAIELDELEQDFWKDKRAPSGSDQPSGVAAG
jgi:ATP-binding cassette subfamily F protein 3